LMDQINAVAQKEFKYGKKEESKENEWIV
jgi:hypothetical protein